MKRGWLEGKRERDEKARGGTEEARDDERERDVHAKVHEREPRMRARESTRTHECDGGVCLLYRGTKRCEKE